jgi:hypothetical protein
MLALVGLALSILDYEYCSEKTIQFTDSITPPPKDKAYVQV